MKKIPIIFLLSLFLVSCSSKVEYIDLENKISNINDVYVLKAYSNETYCMKSEYNIDDFCKEFKKIDFKVKDSYIKCYRNIIVFEKNDEIFGYNQDFYFTFNKNNDEYEITSESYCYTKYSFDNLINTYFDTTNDGSCS